MTKDVQELTEEIRKLRKEIKELRESSSGTHIHHHYAPLPVYVPQYPLPSYVPWWGTQTVTATPCPTTTTSCGFTVLNNAVALPATTQISLT